MLSTDKMQRIIISTIIRNTPADQPSGSLYTFELSSGKAILKSTIIEPPHREKDNNLRGGIRGLRGIIVREDQIILSNASEIFRYDASWRLLGRFSHPSCSSIHDIICQNDTIWITSSRNDLLIQFDMAGNLLKHLDIRRNQQVFSETHWKPSPFLTKDQIVQGAIDFRDPASHNFHASDTAHLNGIDLLPNGNLIISYGLMLNSGMEHWLIIKNWLFERGLWKPILVINQNVRNLLKKPSHTKNELVFHPASAESAVVEIDHQENFISRLHLFGITVPGHSIRILQDGTAVFLNTGKGQIIHFHPLHQKPISTSQLGNGFLRGVRQLNDESLLLGDNQTLIRFDIYKQKIISMHNISDNPNESIYDINILPDHFDLPPLSFI